MSEIFPDMRKVDIICKQWHYGKRRCTELTLLIFTLISSNVLEKNRYYVKFIAEVIQFLVVNKLALRGNFNIEDYEEQDLFKNLFEYTLKKDKYLLECQL